jgi:nicotinamidase-related amidase
MTARRVLLLIDAQVAMLSDPPLGVPASRSIKNNISRILTEARSAKPSPLIIHVRNTGESGEPDEPGTAGWELYFPPLPNEPVIDKLKNNAFAGTKLGDLIPPGTSSPGRRLKRVMTIVKRQKS